MKIKDLLEATSPIIAFHGSPSKIEQFKNEFLGKGYDKLGSGFYFTSDYDDALMYSGETKNVYKVSLDLKKPLDFEKVGSMSKAQVVKIIKMSPILEDSLWDYDDVGTLGVARVLNNAADNFVFRNEPILQWFHKLANDFFRNHPDSFNKAIFKVLGYDSVIHHMDTGVTHYMAFFPEQITILK